MKHERTYVIYCYTNKINGKKYVGQTCTSLEERAGKDGCHYVIKRGAFGNAIQKYGWDSFISEILEDGLTLEEANEREQYWISELNTISPNGYNLQPGGLNHVMLDVSKQKLSQSKIGHEVSPETREKIGKVHRGKVTPDEVKMKISKSSKGRTISDKTREKISKSHFGKKLSDETKRKIGNAQRGVNKDLLGKGIQKISMNGKLICEYSSLSEAWRQTGVNYRNICSVCQGKRKTAGGYIWKYKEVA